MANKDLKGTKFEIDTKLMSKLKGIYSTFSQSDKIQYSRLEELISKGFITYEGMKRIKNFFDTMSQQDSPDEYRKNGGTALRDWVEFHLNDARDSVEKSKEIKSEYGGMSNQHNKAHQHSDKMDRDYLLAKLKITENFKKLI